MTHEADNAEIRSTASIFDARSTSTCADASCAVVALGQREFDVSDVDYVADGELPTPTATFAVVDGVVHEILR